MHAPKQSQSAIMCIAIHIHMLIHIYDIHTYMLIYISGGCAKIMWPHHDWVCFGFPADCIKTLLLIYSNKSLQQSFKKKEEAV